MEQKNGWLGGRACGCQRKFVSFLEIESMFVYCWELLSRQGKIGAAEARGASFWNDVFG